MKKINHRNNRRHAGFSLVELVISLVVLSVILGFVAKTVGEFLRSDARHTELEEAVTRHSVVGDSLHSDFKNPMKFLSSSSLFNVGTFSAKFDAHPDYDTTVPGLLPRSQITANQFVRSNFLLDSGGASAVFQPDCCSDTTFGWQTFPGGPTSDYQAIVVGASDVTGSREFIILSSAGEELRGSIPDNPDHIEAKIERLSTGCRTAFYALYQFNPSVLLGRSRDNCPAYPLEAIADVGRKDGYISDIKLTGSFKAKAQSSSQQAPLPFVQGSQITTPVFINAENNDLVLFRAEDSTDKTYTRYQTAFSSGQASVVTVQKPSRGGFAVGSNVFIVDYTQSVSLVGSITSVSDSADGISLDLRIKPFSSSTDAAWGLFYSRPQDFTGRTFAVGAEIVSLAAPVQYRYYPADKQISRREGSGLWQTVAPGIRSFTAAIAGNTLTVDIASGVEGVELLNNYDAQTGRIVIPIN